MTAPADSTDNRNDSCSFRWTAMARSSKKTPNPIAPNETKDAARPSEAGAWISALMMRSNANPNAIKAKEFCIQLVRVRSVAARLRSLASSVVALVGFSDPGPTIAIAP